MLYFSALNSHADGPPSYDSLFGEIKAAKEGSAGHFDFMLKFFGIIFASGMELVLKRGLKILMMLTRCLWSSTLGLSLTSTRCCDSCVCISKKLKTLFTLSKSQV